jgi:hypothetical protein
VEQPISKKCHQGCSTHYCSFYNGSEWNNLNPLPNLYFWQRSYERLLELLDKVVPRTIAYFIMVSSGTTHLKKRGARGATPVTKVRSYAKIKMLQAPFKSKIKTGSIVYISDAYDPSELISTHPKIEILN